MSNQIPPTLIKFRNRSKKNHEISSQVNQVIQKAYSDFFDAMPEILDPDIDPYLSMCLDSREKDFLGFEQMMKAYQETN